MSDDRDWSDYAVEDIVCRRETKGGALVCCVRDGKPADEFLIPKGLVRDDSEVFAVGTEGTLVIPTWLAEEKNL